MVRQFGAPVVLRFFKGFPGVLPKHTVGNKAVGIDRLLQSPLAQEAKSSRTAEWPSGTLLSLLFCCLRHQCPLEKDSLVCWSLSSHPGSMDVWSQLWPVGP